MHSYLCVYLQESAFRETLTEADIYMSQMEFQYRKARVTVFSSIYLVNVKMIDRSATLYFYTGPKTSSHK